MDQEYFKKKQQLREKQKAENNQSVIRSYRLDTAPKKPPTPVSNTSTGKILTGRFGMSTQDSDDILIPEELIEEKEKIDKQHLNLQNRIDNIQHSVKRLNELVEKYNQITTQELNNVTNKLMKEKDKK